jgi:hypothetical protein
MPLQYDGRTGQISYEGQVVAEHRVENGKARVTLHLTYECEANEWVVPISWLDVGLSHLAKHRELEPDVAVVMVSSEDAIEERFDVPRLLTEKTIKQGGFVWRFHKNDADQWPSRLHGHDKAANLVLDALTGQAYDSTTRQCCFRLNKKEITRIQEGLRRSADFVHRLPEP